jgi:hypothetical protein
MAGRQDYEERRQARIDRLIGAASAASARSVAESTKAYELVKDIPFGQPNIIGRPALPALRERSGRCMDRAIEADKTSIYYAERAEAAQGNGAISSDDPNSIEKLTAKIAKLEAERDAIKAANKEAKKTGGTQSAWYTLPYLGRDIKAAKERIEKLQKTEAMPAELIEFEGGEIESDPETNRVIIRFDERQDEDTTSRLRLHGFKWAPSVGGWQRLRSPVALRYAKMICEIKKEEQA